MNNRYSKEKMLKKCHKISLGDFTRFRQLSYDELLNLASSSATFRTDSKGFVFSLGDFPLPTPNVAVTLIARLVAHEIQDVFAADYGQRTPTPGVHETAAGTGLVGVFANGQPALFDELLGHQLLDVAKNRVVGGQFDTEIAQKSQDYFLRNHLLLGLAHEYVGQYGVQQSIFGRLVLGLSRGNDT